MGVQQFWLLFMEQQIARAKIDSTTKACNDLAGFVEVDCFALASPPAAASEVCQQRPSVCKQKLGGKDERQVGRRWSFPSFLRRKSAVVVGKQ
jgi:hypothetical protein